VIRVGIVAPMRGEAKCFTDARLAPGEPREIADGVLVCMSGVGAERASRAVEALIAHGAGAIVSAGIAGGLDATLAPGHVVLAERVLDAHGDAHATDREWREQLFAHLQGQVACSIGLLVESARVLATPAQKRACHAQTGALAVDMESAAVVSTAARAHAPCLVVRAICDPASLTLPASALAGVDAVGHPRLARLALALCRHPTEIAGLVKLQRAFQSSQTALRAVLRVAGPRLGAPER
jgi:adenosylhomocysteine nucleosidase